jgi:hypothetical protein
MPQRIDPTDVLVIWNRYGLHDAYAQRYISAGARVLVAENGYLPKDKKGRRYYALALEHHNGAGRWYGGDSTRWRDMGLEVAPWRTDGDHILVLPQRGVGPPGVAMPRNWAAETVKALKRVTKRPVKLRPHPGKNPTPLEPDLANAWCCVTWGSGAGVKALLAGIPVVHSFTRWIGASACGSEIAKVDAPYMGDRLAMFERLAWAQWHVDEISAGKPFERLLNG